MTNLRLHFDKPLLHATIKSRINRFIFIVDYNGLEVEAHCPSGGTIAGIPRKLMTQLPCLLSDHGDNTTRRTRYTVEAISLDNGHTYMGINQTASNHYVHQFLQNEDVQSVLNINGPVAREKKLGNSRIDFKVDDTYIEVKTMVAEYYGKASKQLRAFNVIARADLNDFLEESFKFDEVAHLRTYSDLNYTSECKSPLVTSVKYDDGQPELESEALLLDFAEVFNEVPSLYSELFSQSQYPILIELI